VIPYLLKSMLILAVTYGFYFFFLQHLKTFTFNRFYLLFSILFSLLIPLVEISVGFIAPVGQGLNDLGYATGELIQGEHLEGESIWGLSLGWVVKALYGLITAVFLIRFLVNIVKIIQKTKNAISVPEQGARIKFVEEKTLPYSFFNCIVVNREEYENKKIDAELLLHEQAHCSQYHSVDILIIELLKTVAWFNPFIWMFKQTIQINHEYLADQSVLAKSKPEPYLHILVNLTVRNNSAYLASDFNYSLTKKRLLMMTKNNNQDNAFIKRLATIPLFILLAVTFTFSQETSAVDLGPDPAPEEAVANNINDWWKPILERHNIEISAYNNFEYVFEMGSTNSIEDGIVTLTDALFIIRNEGEAYTILRSPLAYHYLETNTIEGLECTIDVYDPTVGGIDSKGTVDMFKYKYQVTGSVDSWEAQDSIVVTSRLENRQ
jgi:hypothetical protein